MKSNTKEAYAMAVLAMGTLILALAAAWQPSEASPAGLSDRDKLFLKESARDGLFAAEWNHLAETRLRPGRVRDFAGRLLMEFAAINKKVEDIVISLKEDIDLPRTPSEKNSDRMQKLERVREGEVRKIYVRETKNFLEELHKRVDRATREADRLEIQSLAARMETAVQNHFQTIKEIEDRMAEKSALKAGHAQ